jgi:hypothetical protein
MLLKRADQHHEPKNTFWKDGRNGMLFSMEDSEWDRPDRVRCFATHQLLRGLRGDVVGGIEKIFLARREHLEQAAAQYYGAMGKPTEIVLDEVNYPPLRAGLFQSRSHPDDA